MNKRPLGIIDSGLGGLTITRAIWSQLPQESSIYLADHQFFPYGDKNNLAINQRLIKLVNFLLTKNCKAIVLACNTITTLSIKSLRLIYQIPFI